MLRIPIKKKSLAERAVHYVISELLRHDPNGDPELSACRSDDSQSKRAYSLTRSFRQRNVNAASFFLYNVRSFCS